MRRELLLVTEIIDAADRHLNTFGYRTGRHASVRQSRSPGQRRTTRRNGLEPRRYQR